jgi:hypothetical protein
MDDTSFALLTQTTTHPLHQRLPSNQAINLPLIHAPPEAPPPRRPTSPPALLSAGPPLRRPTSPPALLSAGPPPRRPSSPPAHLPAGPPTCCQGCQGHKELSGGGDHLGLGRSIADGPEQPGEFLSNGAVIHRRYAAVATFTVHRQLYSRQYMRGTVSCTAGST